MADKEKIKQATKNAVSKVCDFDGNEIVLTNNCRSAREDAHKSRNQFQKNICPTNLSKSGEGYDEATGIRWYRDLGPYFSDYHETDDGTNEICYRGKPTNQQLDVLKQNEKFRRNVETLGGNLDTVNPGYQCCYNPLSGNLSGSSSFDYDSDKSYEGQIIQGIGQAVGDTDHEKLDILPSKEFGEDYDPANMSSGKNVDRTLQEQLQKEEMLRQMESFGKHKK